MALFLLDRDGVVVVNRRDNIKTPADLELIAGAGRAIARLNQAGVTVAICTNQPEVGRGVMSRAALDAVHRALVDRLAAEGATIERVLVCTAQAKCPRLKPASGMLAEALARYGAAAAETPFVGDQADDLRAAFHAGCRRVLVRTGLGRKTLDEGIPVLRGAGRGARRPGRRRRRLARRPALAGGGARASRPLIYHAGGTPALRKSSCPGIDARLSKRGAHRYIAGKPATIEDPECSRSPPSSAPARARRTHCAAPCSRWPTMSAPTSPTRWASSSRRIWKIPRVFTTYERFTDRAAMDRHNGSAVVAKFFAIAKPLLDGAVTLVTGSEISAKG